MELKSKVSTLKGIGLKKAQALSKYGMDTLEDMLYFFPRKYEDRRQETAIKDLETGKDFLFAGTVISKRYSGNPYKKNTPLSLLVDDGTSMIEVVFFQGRYIEKLLQVNQKYTFYGRITSNFDRLQCVHPEFHPYGDAGDVRGILPIYPGISGISQNELRKIQLQLKCLYHELEEWLPEDIVKEYHLASPSYAVEHIHFPTDGRQVLSSKYRLIFDELLALETGLFYIKNDLGNRENGISFANLDIDRFIESLPFQLTEGQQTAWESIKGDLASPKAMARLKNRRCRNGHVCRSEIRLSKCHDGTYRNSSKTARGVFNKGFCTLWSQCRPSLQQHEGGRKTTGAGRFRSGEDPNFSRHPCGDST